MIDIFTDAAHELALLADEAPLGELEDAAQVLAVSPDIFVTGVGKSGLAARKLADSLAAHGVPAHFLDPVEALHGGLGRVRKLDAVVALSVSGNTVELIRLTTALGRHFDVGIYGRRGSALETATDSQIVAGVTSSSDEVTDFVPSLSFITQCLIGDALALRVAELRGAAGPAATHPGGNLGATEPWARRPEPDRLTKVPCC